MTRMKSATWGTNRLSLRSRSAEPVARKSSLMSARATGEMGTLMVGGPERKGIHARLAQLLADHNVNIIHSGQHTGGGMFFERIRFDLSELETGREQFEASRARVCGAYGLDYRPPRRSQEARRDPRLEVRALSLRPARALSHRRSAAVRNRDDRLEPPRREPIARSTSASRSFTCR